MLPRVFQRAGLAMPTLLGLLGCSQALHAPSGLAAVPPALIPAELVGEFACSFDRWRSRMKLRADGRYLEWAMAALDEGRWRTFGHEKEPCDPWGRARFADATLTLSFQPATCDELGEPETLPRVGRSLVIRTADANHFGGDDWRCERVAASEASGAAQRDGGTTMPSRTPSRDPNPT